MRGGGKKRTVKSSFSPPFSFFRCFLSIQRQHAPQRARERETEREREREREREACPRSLTLTQWNKRHLTKPQWSIQTLLLAGTRTYTHTRRHTHTDTHLSHLLRCSCICMSIVIYASWWGCEPIWEQGQHTGQLICKSVAYLWICVCASVCECVCVRIGGCFCP